MKNVQILRKVSPVNSEVLVHLQNIGTSWLARLAICNIKLDIDQARFYNCQQVFILKLGI